MSISFNDFYEKIEPSLPAAKRFALSLTKDASSADDLVQQAILNGYKNQSNGGKPVESPKPWLCSIILNLVRSEKNQEKRHEEGTKAAFKMGYLGGEMSPSRGFQLVALGEVWALVNRLPVIYREAITLMIVEGHSSEEASTLALHPANAITMRVRLLRAKQMLGCLMQQPNNQAALTSTFSDGNQDIPSDNGFDLTPPTTPEPI